MRKKNKIPLEAKITLVLIFVLMGIFLLLISVLLATNCLYRNNNFVSNNQITNSEPKNELKIDKAEVDQNYRLGVIEIIKNYLIQDSNLPKDGYQAKVDNTNYFLNETLKLTLNSTYKDLHLNLVLAFDKAVNGYEAYIAGRNAEGEKLLKESGEMFDEIIQANDWLKID